MIDLTDLENGTGTITAKSIQFKSINDVKLLLIESKISLENEVS